MIRISSVPTVPRKSSQLLMLLGQIEPTGGRWASAEPVRQCSANHRFLLAKLQNSMKGVETSLLLVWLKAPLVGF